MYGTRKLKHGDIIDTVSRREQDPRVTRVRKS